MSQLLSDVVILSSQTKQHGLFDLREVFSPPLSVFPNRFRVVNRFPSHAKFLSRAQTLLFRYTVQLMELRIRSRHDDPRQKDVSIRGPVSRDRLRRPFCSSA